jgi:hypothetical protein
MERVGLLDVVVVGIHQKCLRLAGLVTQGLKCHRA